MFIEPVVGQMVTVLDGFPGRIAQVEPNGIIIRVDVLDGPLAGRRLTTTWGQVTAWAGNTNAPPGTGPGEA